MKTKMILAAGLVAFVSGSNARAEALNAAKAGELTCHRIERLAALKKIPDSFLQHLSTIEVQPLAAQKPTDPVFRSLTSQVPGADGHAQQLELLLDAQGKTVDFHVLAGPDSVNAPVWPDKDAFTFAENTMHFLLENVSKDATLQPFYNELSSVVVTQAMDAAGQVQARVLVHATQGKPVLELLYKANGSLVSYQVISQP